MSKHNNIYNILGKLSALEPKPEPAKSILGELTANHKSDFARHLNERYLAEKDKGMSRAAKGHEKYGKEGMEALAKAGKEGKDLDPIRAKYDKYNDKSVEEGAMSDRDADAKDKQYKGTQAYHAKKKQDKEKSKQAFNDKFGGNASELTKNLKVREGEVDEDMLSPKQQKIAKMSPPPDKIDANDLAALRAGKSKEKEGNEFSGELAKAKAQHKDSFSVDGKEYPVKEDNLDPANHGEYDREGEMADQDLETAQDAAEELRSILDADENLPEWVQAKITKAVDYLDTARDYMQSKDQDPDLQEGWDDMMKSVKDRADQGTGKFDKQTTSTGTRYTRKPETFADPDSEDGESKASDAPKKKGRPKKNTGPERTTSKAWKHKGSRVSESVKLDTFVEDTLAEMDAIMVTEKAASKQQQKFMGMVHAMQKGEKVKGASKELKKTADSMSKKDAKDFASTKHKGLPKKVTEGVLLENTLSAIEHRYGKEVRDFMETGDMDDDLYHALYDYYFDDMPYGVKKARDGDPYEWISDRFFDEMGGAGFLNRKDNANGIEESGALHPGQVVYYRGQRGEIDRIEGNKCFVHVGDGDMDVWPTNSCSTDRQSFMSTMKNDIKDIGYGMKGFLTGGPETRELDELAKLAGLGQQKLGEAACNMTAEGEMCAKHGFAECWSSSMYESKGEKPDFLDADKDGDKEEPMTKAIDDKKKNPFGNKKELEECGMPGSMAPEAESGMNINSSMDTKTGRKTLSVTADGAAAEQLAQMLKMAGMVGGHSHEAEPDHHKVVLINPMAHGDQHEMGPEEPMDEEYANDPNEQYVSNDALMNQGQDLNRKKKQYAGMPKAGDNPMATEDAVRLEGKLAKLYDSIKVRN